MRIRNISHKALRRFYTENNTKGLPAAAVDKLTKMLAFLQDMANARELESIPVWKAHALTGARKGTWSLHVTRNWRLTFRIDERENEICDLNLEDYH